MKGRQFKKYYKVYWRMRAFICVGLEGKPCEVNVIKVAVVLEHPSMSDR